MQTNHRDWMLKALSSNRCVVFCEAVFCPDRARVSPCKPHTGAVASRRVSTRVEPGPDSTMRAITKDSRAQEVRIVAARRKAVLHAASECFTTLMRWYERTYIVKVPMRTSARTGAKYIEELLDPERSEVRFRQILGISRDVFRALLRELPLERTRYTAP